MKKFGLVGNPLLHSMSKVIHEALFEIKNINASYELYESDNLDKVYDDILKDLDGFNITIPYKRDIIGKINEKSGKVLLYNACNTVISKNNTKYGYNTDVSGFLETLKINEIDLKNKNVLITGAGGVSKMMACEALIAGAKVSIYARNTDKAEFFIKEIKEKTGYNINYVLRNEIRSFDILLQGTPAGMYPDFLSSPVPLSSLKDIPFVFDTIYNPSETLLLRVSKYFNNTAVSGLNMLVRQAAKAQELYFDVKFTDEDIKKVAYKVKPLLKQFSLNKNIILIGPPGSGKTTLGKELAKILNAKFYDIDREIEKEENLSISKIFEIKNKAYFRKKETEHLLKSINCSGNIISTGGGIVEYNNLDELKSDNDIVVFIDVDSDLLIKRLKSDQKRPLLKGDIKDNLLKLLNKRYPLYNKYSDIIIKGNDTVKETVIKIIDNILF